MEEASIESLKEEIITLDKIILDFKTARFSSFFKITLNEELQERVDTMEFKLREHIEVLEDHRDSLIEKLENLERIEERNNIEREDCYDRNFF